MTFRQLKDGTKVKVVELNLRKRHDFIQLLLVGNVKYE